jgi:hypothetical protein
MNLAEADPMATNNPIVNGSMLVILSAIFDAMKRFEGPANGIMFRRKEVKRIPRISNTDPSFKPLKALLTHRNVIKPTALHLFATLQVKGLLNDSRTLDLNQGISKARAEF